MLVLQPTVLVSCHRQGAQGASHPGEGNVVLAIRQFSQNLPVSLNNANTVKNLKLAQVEHARSNTHGLRQHVIVMRGRFATQESPVLDLDIMVEVSINTKE